MVNVSASEIGEFLPRVSGKEQQADEEKQDADVPVRRGARRRGAEGLRQPGDHGRQDTRRLRFVSGKCRRVVYTGLSTRIGGVTSRMCCAACPWTFT